jgi:uncharacterized protein DUF3800
VRFRVVRETSRERRYVCSEHGATLTLGLGSLSGMPERLGRRQLILTLQAYFDDSGGKGQGRWMVMSGLFGEAEVLAAVADEWDKYLAARHPGRIRYFKMDEACQVDGEFKDWRVDNRNAKVLQMASVIDRSSGLLEIAARVDLQAHRKIGERWAHVKAKRGDLQRFHTMDQPYMMLVQYVIVTAVTEAVARGATAPIEIIFDEQSLFEQSVRASYPELREIERDAGDRERSAVLPVQPWFRDDKECVILQAADLLAGELRLASEGYSDNPEFVGTLCPHLRVSKFYGDIGEQQLGRVHTHLTETLEREERAAEALHKQGGCDD